MSISTVLIILITTFLIAIGVWLYFRIYKIEHDKALPQSDFAYVQGHRLHYSQVGQGPHLLLLHGIGASTYVWRLLTPYLSKYFTVTAVDILGFGLSDKPKNFSYDLDSQASILCDFCTELGIKQTRVVGSSMGGALSLWLTLQYPDLYFECIALAPAYSPQIALYEFDRFSFLSKYIKTVVNRALIEKLLNRVVNKKELITEESINSYLEPYVENPDAIHAFMKSFQLLRDSRLKDSMPRLKTPTLIIWGEQDKVVPVKFFYELKSLAPQAQFIIHKSGGHHLMEDEPEWLSQQILHFFKPKSL